MKINELLLSVFKDNEATSGYLTGCIQTKDLPCFSEDINNIMQARNISIAELSEKTNLSIERIKEILSTNNDPKLSELIAILKVLNLQLAIEELNPKS